MPDMGMPIIGADGHRVSEKLKVAPSPKVDESLKIIDQMSKSEEAPKTPQELYEEGIKAVGLDLATARQIKEQVLTDGYYEEPHRIGPVLVKIRSRQYKDTIRLRRAMEADQLEFPININSLIHQYNAAASLVQYGQEVFDIPDYKAAEHKDIEDCFRKRLDFMTNLPDMVTEKLQQLVFTFDAKLRAVFAEGAPEDF